MSRLCTDLAKPFHKYFACWFDPTDKTHGIVSPINGIYESGDSWLEIEEIISYIRAEGDGLHYFVGDKDSNPVLPSFEEVVESLRIDKELGLSPYPALVRANYLLQVLRGARLPEKQS